MVFIEIQKELNTFYEQTFSRHCSHICLEGLGVAFTIISCKIRCEVKLMKIWIKTHFKKSTLS